MSVIFHTFILLFVLFYFLVVSWFFIAKINFGCVAYIKVNSKYALFFKLFSEIQ